MKVGLLNGKERGGGQDVPSQVAGSWKESWGGWLRKADLGDLVMCQEASFPRTELSTEATAVPPAPAVRCLESWPSALPRFPA